MAPRNCSVATHSELHAYTVLENDLPATLKISEARKRDTVGATKMAKKVAKASKTANKWRLKNLTKFVLLLPDPYIYATNSNRL